MRKILLWIGAAVVMTAAFFMFSACKQSAHYHCWKETVYVAAMCETDGEKIFLCACGEQKPRTESAVGHQLVLMPEKTPTCGEDGYTEYRVCNQCNYTEKTVLTATGEHTWDEGEQIDDANEIFKEIERTLKRSYDPRIPFIIAALTLFLLDIAVRKFKFKWPHEIVRDYKAKKILKQK